MISFAQNMMVTDTEYIILENIYEQAGQPLSPRQRELARIAGTSLGMTNSILKRLAQKGWITIKKLNSRNIQYAVTLEGINEIIHRSYGYFKRTIKNAVYYKETLEELVREAKQRNISTVRLVGTSDLDFIVEHACRRWGLNLARTSEGAAGENMNAQPVSGTLKIYAESIPEKREDENRFSPGKGPERSFAAQGFYLSRLVIKQAARADTAQAETVSI